MSAALTIVPTIVPPANSNTVSLGNHVQQMQQLIANTPRDQIVTVEHLFGPSDVNDPRVVLAVRSFASVHKSLGIRASDVDAHVAAVKRAAKAAARVAKAGTNALDERQTDLYQWVSDEMDRLGIAIDCGGNVQHPRYDTHTLTDALTVLNTDNAKPYPDRALKAAINLSIGDRRRERLAALRDHLSGRHLLEAPQTVFDRLRHLFSLGLDPSNAYSAEDAVRIVCKTVWQVKRKLSGAPVTWHTMLVLVGAQGGGKSSLVDHLVDPLREVTVSTDLRAITDDRNIQLFGNYVGVIDELDKADRTSVETLKRVITDATMSRRPMQTNTMVNIRQNLTFVGTSNREVSEAIIDETGNRRFVSLTLINPDHPDKAAFWAAINGYDWLSLWRAVDETADDPTLPIADIIRQTQRAERSKSSIELWLERRTEDGASIVTPGAFTGTADLFNDYRDWEEQYAPRASGSYTVFAKAFSRLSKHGMIPFEAARRSSANGYRALPQPKPAWGE